MLPMETASQPINVISVFPDKANSDSLRKRLQTLGVDNGHIDVSDQTATHLLNASQELVQALDHRAFDVRAGLGLEEREAFSRIARNCLPAAIEGGRYLVVSPATVPLDLAFDAGGNWGDRAIYSHLYSYDAPSAGLLTRALWPKELPLEGYLLLCPMAMDRAIPRHLQDIVTVALELESRMPVELWLQPRYDRATQALARTDLSWLHIDTHGTPTKIMLGSTREDQELAGAEDLPPRVFTPLFIIVGCALASGPESISSVLFQRGAEAVFGPCAIFQSLGVANSEEGEATWYRVLFDSLLTGFDIGMSLLRARRSVAGSGILKYAYLIVGSSFLRFDVNRIPTQFSVFTL
jgi:hypothetical protein